MQLQHCKAHGIPSRSFSLCLKCKGTLVSLFRDKPIPAHWDTQTCATYIRSRENGTHMCAGLSDSGSGPNLLYDAPCTGQTVLVRIAI